MRRSMCAVLVLSLCLAAPLYAHHVKKAESGTLPVTTSSPEARELYEKGMADYENLYLERCNGEWHDLPPEFITPRWDILDSAPDVDANKRSDNQRLPFDKATDGKQKNSEREISALQIKKSRDQKRREPDVQIGERDAA